MVHILTFVVCQVHTEPDEKLLAKYNEFMVGIFKHSCLNTMYSLLMSSKPVEQGRHLLCLPLDPPLHRGALHVPFTRVLVPHGPLPATRLAEGLL